MSRSSGAAHRQLVHEAGLNDRIMVLRCDYSDLRGRYDKLVSIEMIEAVRWRHTGRFLGACSRLVESDGAMLLHAITIDDRAYEGREGISSFIKERIFPRRVAAVAGRRSPVTSRGTRTYS